MAEGGEYEMGGHDQPAVDEPFVAETDFGGTDDFTLPDIPVDEHGDIEGWRVSETEGTSGTGTQIAIENWKAAMQELGALKRAPSRTLKFRYNSERRRS